MRYLIFLAALLPLAITPWSLLAWDGFDAESTDLVEIIPDRVPSPGDSVEVRNYENDASQEGIVESVVRNKRTIEVVIRDPNGKRRTLVMEGR